jgi:DNA-binding transcriptional MocR family regulator
MDLRIDRQALVPVVQQIVDALTGWLCSGTLAPGACLPSVRQIAHHNLLSQSSVIQACERLVAQGLLVPGHGAGFRVAAPVRATIARQEYSWLDSAQVCADAHANHLQLGCGSLPDSWRETDDLAYAIRQVSHTDMASLFNYSSPMGLPALRQHMVKRLEQLGIHTQADRVLTTAGASQGLDLVVRTLFRPGDCVIVESPGYPLLFQLLRLHGIAMLEVPRTPCGPDVQVLEALMREHRPRGLFINSFHHNPTGCSLTPAVARQVLELARNHDVRVIEDDVYADFHAGPGMRLAALDEQVIYIASYSKTLSSSLRVGFVVADAGLISRLAEVKMISSMGGSGFCEAVLACLLANGAYRKLVLRQRQRLSRDRLATLQMLEDAEWEVFGRPTGGLFIWARSRICDAAQVQMQARRFAVVLSSPTAFSAVDESHGWLRINVAYAGDPRARAFFQATAQATSAVLKTTDS